MRHSRAYSLVIVMMTLGLLTVAIFSLWAFIEVQVQTTKASHARKEVFYVCDGLTRLVGALAGHYASRTDNPTPAGFAAWLGGERDADQLALPRLEELTPPGSVVNPADVGITEVSRSETARSLASWGKKAASSSRSARARRVGSSRATSRRIWQSPRSGSSSSPS